MSTHVQHKTNCHKNKWNGEGMLIMVMKMTMMMERTAAKRNWMEGWTGGREKSIISNNKLLLYKRCGRARDWVVSSNLPKPLHYANSVCLYVCLCVCLNVKYIKCKVCSSWMHQMHDDNRRCAKTERRYMAKEETEKVSEQAQINFVIYVRIAVLAATLIFYLFNLLSRNHRLFVSRLFVFVCMCVSAHHVCCLLPCEICVGSVMWICLIIWLFLLLLLLVFPPVEFDVVGRCCHLNRTNWVPLFS